MHKKFLKKSLSIWKKTLKNWGWFDLYNIFNKHTKSRGFGWLTLMGSQTDKFTLKSLGMWLAGAVEFVILIAESAIYPVLVKPPPLSLFLEQSLNHFPF